MSKFWIIFKKEYAQVVKKRSFIIGIVLTPLLMGTFTIVPSMLAKVKSSSSEYMAVIDQSQMHIGQRFSAELEDYKLEKSDEPYYIINRIFEIIPEDSVKFEEIYDSLKTAILDSEIKYFLVIRPDPLHVDTNIFLVTNSDNFTSLQRFEWQLTKVLSTIRLIHADINLSVDSVLTLTRHHDLQVKDAKGEMVPFQVKYFAAIAFVGIIFGMIVGYGQMVMRSVIDEKNSRIMEVMISSVSPFEFMLGKILGLGAATLTQVAVWFLFGALIYTQKTALDISPAIDRVIFNAPLMIFFALFLISGYIMYSSIFALIGSIVTTEKEAQNFVMPVTMTMVLPFMLGIYIVQEPNSVLAVTLSMIPLLAPTMMVMRVAFLAPSLTEYSIFSGIIGEAVLSFFIVLIFTVFMVWLTGKIFRVGILMYGKRPTLPEILKWIKY